MIHGVGTDLCRVERVAALVQRWGRRAAERILAPDEMSDYLASRDPARLLAKRFAAKEAFAKALGTGVRQPATLHAIRVCHDDLGRPLLAFGPELRAWMTVRGLRAHLSLSDEVEHALAFVVVEQMRDRQVEGGGHG